MNSKKIKLAIIDSNAVIHRAFHALPPMHTKAGEPTNAVYGFTTMFLKMLSLVKPTHVVATFDLPGRTFRKDKFEAYKEHRKPTADDLIPQFEFVKELLASFEVPVLTAKGYEADDIIGTLVELYPDISKVVITGDMDTLQLVDDNTSIFTLKGGVTDTILYTPELVRAKWGFDPIAMIEYKGLRGDASDNIPGVKGVGEKTAKDLLAKYGTIEEIYEHFDELPTRAQTRLKGQEKEAKLSRELATIARDVPIEFSLDDAVFDGYDSAKLRVIFDRFEFRSLLQKLPKGFDVGQPTLFSSKSDAVESLTMPDNYALVEGEADNLKLIEELSRESLIAFDTENDSLGAREYPIVGMSFAVRRGDVVRAWYVPVTPETVLVWKDFFENESIKKTGHNLKYDIEVLAQSGIVVRGVVFDSMIAGYLLNPSSRSYGLDALAGQELNHNTIPISRLLGDGKSGMRMSQVPLNDLSVYAGEDADVSLRLYEAFYPKIEAEKLTRVMDELEIPLIPVLVHMELSGVGVDREVFKALGVRVRSRIQELTARIVELAGEDFNINSTKQLRVILFEKLNLPTVGIKKTQTGYSTAASELEKLHGQHEIIALLEEYRELTKLNNTYIETLPKLIDKNTGRIYASFNQVVAATGRLSSSDPNLQNIPVRTELGQEIRSAFVAEDGYTLIKADYSQVELRLTAHLSQDEKMMQVFRDGGDIHSATAGWVYGIPAEDVTSDQRRQAKALNFGVLYGMGPQAFARSAGVSVEEARSFIGRYREQYRGLGKFIESTVMQARSVGYVETMFGRRRYIPEINSSNPAVLAQAERIAFNFPIQGTAADLLKKAMIELYAHMREKFVDARMVLTVHDELVCEVPDAEALDFARDIRSVMEGVLTLDVPLIVDVAVGQNWRDTEEVAR